MESTKEQIKRLRKMAASKPGTSGFSRDDLAALKMAVKTLDSIADVIVVTDDGSLFEALYINGRLVQPAETIYASDIEHALNGRAMRLRTKTIGLEDNQDFPANLEECDELELSDGGE